MKKQTKTVRRLFKAVDIDEILYYPQADEGIGYVAGKLAKFELVRKDSASSREITLAESLSWQARMLKAEIAGRYDDTNLGDSGRLRWLAEIKAALK